MSPDGPINQHYLEVPEELRDVEEAVEILEPMESPKLKRQQQEESVNSSRKPRKHTKSPHYAVRTKGHPRPVLDMQENVELKLLSPAAKKGDDVVETKVQYTAAHELNLKCNDIEGEEVEQRVEESGENKVEKKVDQKPEKQKPEKKKQLEKKKPEKKKIEKKKGENKKKKGEQPTRRRRGRYMSEEQLERVLRQADR